MEKQILNKTDDGLQIFSFILNKYYPFVPLVKEGNNRLRTNNPFNMGKPTLEIQVEHGRSFYSDSEKEFFFGDVFDFAMLHYQFDTDAQLFDQLNEEMQLGIETPANPRLYYKKRKLALWKPRMSFFNPPIKNVRPWKSMNLKEVFDVITDEKRACHTTALRLLKDPKQIRNFKANMLPYVCFSGTFRKRGEQHLIKHSHLLVFDFDHLDRPEEVKQLLLNDPYFETELLFLSPSGRGLKWVILLPTKPETHKKYFTAVANYLYLRYNLTVDSCGKDVSRACFLPYDPDAYLSKRWRIFE